MRFGRWMALGALLWLAAGCRKQDSGNTGTETVNPAEIVSPQEARRARPPANPSPAPRAETPKLAATRPGGTMIGPLEVLVPAGWKPQAPSHRMRLAQFRLPAAEGDTHPTEVVVFHFGSGGGSVQANIRRWAGMFAGAEGADPLKDATVRRERIGGLEVTFLDKSGTDRSRGMFMSQPPTEKPNYRMLAAIVVTPQGKFFFRTVGPAKTIAAQKSAFDAMIASISYRGQ